MIRRRHATGTNATGAAGAVLSFLFLALASYFAYSALQGDTGLVAQMHLLRQETSLAAELRAAQEDRARLENLTLRLSERHLDLDLLDERARMTLGLARPDEVVIR